MAEPSDDPPYELLDRLRRFPEITDTSGAWPRGLAFVVLRGDTSARGAYGHVGSYARQLTIDSVLEARPRRASDCPLEPLGESRPRAGSRRL